MIPLINIGAITGVNPAVAERARDLHHRHGARRPPRRHPHQPDQAERRRHRLRQAGRQHRRQVLRRRGGYEAYANQHVYNVAIPGCGTGRVFVGQRKEPFYIAVGKIFDLFNLNPLGPEVGGNKNDLEDKNVSTIALEVPIACLAAAGDPVIGA